DWMRMDNRRSSFDYEDLLACGRGELFAEGPQLPLPPMLMFDRISEIAEAGGEYGKGLVRAVLDLKPDLWFFPCHFKGDPVMPGCLGLDALWQLLGFFLGWLGAPGRGRALGLGELKFSGQVLPTGKNTQEVLASLREAKSGISRAGKYAELGFRCQVHGAPSLNAEEAIDRRALRFLGGGAAWNHIAMEQAIRDAGLEAAEISNER